MAALEARSADENDINEALEFGRDGSVYIDKEKLVRTKKFQDTVKQANKLWNTTQAQKSSAVVPLIEAAHHGHTDTVRALVDAGANVNATDNQGDTALTKAARQGHTDIVQLLINAGADVNPKRRY